MRHTFLSMLLFAAFGSEAVAQAPATRPADRQFSVSPLRVQTLAGIDTYSYGEAQTNFADLKNTIDKLMEPFDKAVAAGKVQPTGPYVFVYKGVSEDMSKPFTLQVGRPIKPGAAGEIKSRKLEPLKAATVVYTGNLANFPPVFPGIYQDLFAAGLTPTGELRENYIYWEGPDSPNNVIIIQIGVK
jgi:hypothetical protein